MEKPWFEVDKKGLEELQEEKPKHYILREFVANAFDEEISKCEVNLSLGFREIKAAVIDDSPEGFKVFSGPSWASLPAWSNVIGETGLSMSEYLKARAKRD